MKALVTGATGFVGRELVSYLNEPLVLSRNASSARQSLGVEAVEWNPIAGPPPAEIFHRVDTVFHLAGEPVAAGRWTRAKKERIRASRVRGTEHLVDRLIALPHPPKTLISASAVGFYGSRGDQILDEQAGNADSFLGSVTRDWEQAASRAEEARVRVVTLRIGIVLGSGGGALDSIVPLFKMGIGGRLGHGRQWMPWIHLSDLVGLMLHVAAKPEIRGAVNGVSPNPVTNREFTRVLARVLGRPAFLPVPQFALRMALGEFRTVLLSSQRVVPVVATASGYRFRYPTLGTALDQILTGKGGEREKVQAA